MNRPSVEACGGTPDVDFEGAVQTCGLDIKVRV